MRLLALIFAGLMVATGCKPPADAPEDLGQLSLFMFENFDSEDVAALDVATLNLETYLVSLDLTAKVDERAVTLPKLTADRLGTVSATEGADLTLQVPVGVSGLSSQDFATNFSAVSETNYICLDSATSKFSERTFESDIDCFMSGECETLATSQWVRKESALGKVWFKLFRDYRKLTLEDGRDVMHARTYMKKSYITDSEKGSWDQNYVYETWIPTAEGDQTLRFYGLWSSVQLALLGDDAWAVLVKDGIDESFQFTDEFLAGNDPADYCNNDRNPDDLTPPTE
jgi:hypothetical protein